MAYIPNIWIDREGTTRYFESIDNDGAKIFTPDYSKVTEIGTPVNADNMNHIEEGIAAGSFTKYDATTVYQLNDLVTFFESNELKVYKSLANENLGNLLTDENYWEEVKLGGGGSSLPIGSTIVLDKALSYEESQGLALQGTYVYKNAVAGERYGYPDFYEQYVNYKNNATATQTTLGSSTITIYTNANGLQFYNIAEKSVIDTFFNSTGVADYYGIDEANERIFLPRNNKFWQFTTNTNEVNDYVEAGLPNIEGTVKSGANGSDFMTGAFTYLNSNTNGTSGRHDGGSDSNYSSGTAQFKASNSNATYGKSNTVQPASSKKLLYYVVGNTVSDTSWVDVVTQVNGGVKDLEDKTQEGIERLKASSNALTTTQITNCITEIPQNIKLELKDGTLTLKAGSKVYVPNGFEADGTTPTFSEVIFNSDKSLKQNFDTNGMFVIVYIKPNGTQFIGTGYKGSTLTSQPTPVGDYKVHYITSENKIFWDAPGEENCSFSLPIAIVNRSAAVGYTSIEQTFNGFGYIGSTVFALPNVKGLCPNGRNADGTLNNIEAHTESVVIYTNKTAGGGHRWYSFMDTTNGVWTRIDFMAVDNLYKGDWNYDEVNNTWDWKGDIRHWCQFALATNETSSPYAITSFNPKLSFRAVDYSDKEEIVSWNIPDYTKGINQSIDTTYTANHDGYITFCNTSGYDDTRYTLTLIYNGVTNSWQFGHSSNAMDNGCAWINYPVPKGSQYKITKDGGGSAYQMIFFPMKGAN